MASLLTVCRPRGQHPTPSQPAFDIRILPAGRFHAAAVVHAVCCRGPARGYANAGRARVAAAPALQHPVDPRHVVGRPPTREPGRRLVLNFYCLSFYCLSRRCRESRMLVAEWQLRKVEFFFRIWLRDVCMNWTENRSEMNTIEMSKALERDGHRK